MKILGVGAIPPTLEHAKSFYIVQAYFIQRELAKLTDLTLRPNLDGVDVTQFDHIIGFGFRHFGRKYDPAAVKALRSTVQGALCQFEDFPCENSAVDLVFACRDSTPRQGRTWAPHAVIGWAADPEICRSAQSNDCLGLLIDHHDYGLERPDVTQSIKEDIERLRASGTWRRGFRAMSVDVLTSPRVGGPDLPFDEIAKKYATAHAFFVTHTETVGGSVIEAATSGALIVTPHGFIDHSLLRTVRHLSYIGNIPWAKVLGAIDPKASREIAARQSWWGVAVKIVAALQGFKKHDPNLRRDSSEPRRPRVPSRSRVFPAKSRFRTR